MALTTAQVIVMSNQRRKTGDFKMLQLVVVACAVQGCHAFLTFVLWLRARYTRMNPMQALHRCASLSLPGVSVLSALAALATPVSSPLLSTSATPPLLSAPAPLKGRIELLQDLAAGEEDVGNERDAGR